MTTLYKPVLIESAEQAEALPEGTLARHSEGAGMAHAHKVHMRNLGGSCWLSSVGVESHAQMIGWTALVPIEAEEETCFVQTRGQAAPEWRTRCVTPWQIATGPEDEAPALADCGDQE